MGDLLVGIPVAFGVGCGDDIDHATEIIVEEGIEISFPQRNLSGGVELNMPPEAAACDD